MKNSKHCNGIECHFHRKSSRDFYIDEAQVVWPCCHYAEMTKKELAELDPKLDKSMKDNPGWNKISENDIESIISNEIYAHDIYFPGWENNPTGACLKFCGDDRFKKIFKQVQPSKYINGVREKKFS